MTEHIDPVADEDLDLARHEPDEEPNIVDPDDLDVEILDGPEDEEN